MDARAYTEVILTYKKFNLDFFKNYNTIDVDLFNQGATIIIEEQLKNKELSANSYYSRKTINFYQSFHLHNIENYIDLLTDENLEKLCVLALINGHSVEAHRFFKKITINPRFIDLLEKETEMLLEQMEEDYASYLKTNHNSGKYFQTSSLRYSKTRAFFNSKFAVFALVPSVLKKVTESIGTPTDFTQIEQNLNMLPDFISYYKDDLEYVKITSLTYAIQHLAFGNSTNQFKVLYKIKQEGWPISIDSLITSTARKVGTKWLDAFLEPFLANLAELEKQSTSEEYLANATDEDKKLNAEFLEDCFIALKNIVLSKNKRSQNKSIFFIEAALNVAAKLRHIEPSIYKELVEPCILKHGETILSMNNYWFEHYRKEHPEHFNELILPFLEKKVERFLSSVETSVTSILEINKIFSQELPNLSLQLYEKLKPVDFLALVNRYNFDITRHLESENPSYEVLNRLFLESYESIDHSSYDLMASTNNSKEIFFKYLQNNPELFKKGIATFLLPFLEYNGTEAPFLTPYKESWKAEDYDGIYRAMDKINGILLILNKLDGFTEEWQKQIDAYKPMEEKTFLGAIITVFGKLFLNQEINGHGLALMLTMQDSYENEDIIDKKQMLLNTLTDLKSTMAEELDLFF